MTTMVLSYAAATMIGAAQVVAVSIAPATASAPAAVGSGAPRPAHDPTFVVSAETTYYITNRGRTDGRADGKLGGVRRDSLEYGYVVTQFRERRAVTGESRWFTGFSSKQSGPVVLSRDEFLARVAATDAMPSASTDGPVVYVHGFAVSFRRAISQGSEIAHRGRFRGAFVVFAWPAHRAITTWPTRSALVSRAYRDDSVTAAASATAFRSALGDLLATVPAGRLTVVGHSLGAQLAAEALAAPSPLHDSLQGVPLRALVLYAPDVATNRFRDVLDSALVPAATRRVIYASQADRMLMFSHLFNGTTRAGQANRGHLLAGAEVEVVDVTDGRRADGVLRKLVEPRHAMRYASAALRDFFGVVRGAAGACRADDGLAKRTGDRSWRLTSAPVPAHDVACTAADSSARR